MTETDLVWVIDDDKSIRWVLEKALGKAGFNVRSFVSAEGVLALLEQEASPCAILSDIRMPGMDGLELLDKINVLMPDLPVIIMTAHSDLDSAVSAFHGGAFEYLPKPFDIVEATEVVRRACHHSQENRDQPIENLRAVGIIGEAPAMQDVFRAIGRLARSNITVLINGESGTGKELVAKALHQHSPRAANTFIALNMAAIPKDLMESELFGHEKGAFTGAQVRRTGRFEQADGGSLFLDEIGDMPMEAQTRLLRVLADGEFYRVGGATPVKADVRIIAATHQDLEGLVGQGKFREDLYHRLNVIKIHIPALRERREDIPLLMNYFLGKAAKDLGEEVKVLLPDSEKLLLNFDWPGNVRQIENMATWLTVMAPGNKVHVGDLPPEIIDTKTEQSSGGGDDWRRALKKWADEKLALGNDGLVNTALPDFESILIHAALEHTKGKKQEAAKVLGLGRNTLTRKLKELDIE